MFPFLILHYLLFMYSQRSMLDWSTITVNVVAKTLLCDYRIAPDWIILF